MTKGLPWFLVERRGDRVRLSEDDAAHALRSLRLQRGAEVTVTDGNGWVARGTLVDEGGGPAVAIAEERTVEPRRPRVRVCVAAPAGDRTWWMVQKLTELGVDEIALVEAARSARRQRGREDHVRRRATAVAREAAKQSRRPFLPEVGVTSGGLFVGAPDGERALVLYEGDAEPMAACLLDSGEDVVSLYVGPEGGLAPEEVEEARARGASLVSLGDQNLRTETAAIAGATLVLSRYGRLG